MPRSLVTGEVEAARLGRAACLQAGRLRLVARAQACLVPPHPGVTQRFYYPDFQSTRDRRPKAIYRGEQPSTSRSDRQENDRRAAARPARENAREESRCSPTAVHRRASSRRTQSSVRVRKPQRAQQAPWRRAGGARTRARGAFFRAPLLAAAARRRPRFACTRRRPAACRRRLSVRRCWPDGAPLTVGAKRGARSAAARPCSRTRTQAGESRTRARVSALGGCRRGASLEGGRPSSRRSSRGATRPRRRRRAPAGDGRRPPRRPAPLDEPATVGETLVPLRDALDVARAARAHGRGHAHRGLAQPERALRARAHCLVRVHGARPPAAAPPRAASCARRCSSSTSRARSASSRRAARRARARQQATAINSLAHRARQGASARSATARRACRIRDSTLTMLLRASLTGSARVAVVVQVAPRPRARRVGVLALEFEPWRAARARRPPRSRRAAVGRSAANARRAAAARTALEQMEADGLGETFGATVSEVRTFKQNARASSKKTAARAARAELERARRARARASSRRSRRAPRAPRPKRRRATSRPAAPQRVSGARRRRGAVSKAAEIKRRGRAAGRRAQPSRPGSSPGDTTPDVT